MKHDITYEKITVHTSRIYSVRHTLECHYDFYVITLLRRQYSKWSKYKLGFSRLEYFLLYYKNFTDLPASEQPQRLPYPREASRDYNDRSRN